MKNRFKAGLKPQALLLASTALFLGVTGAAHAQQNGNQQGWGNQNQQGWGNRNGQQGQGQNRTQMREQMLRQTLASAGYTDKSLQDVVIAFSSAQETSKQTLRQSLNQLRQLATASTTTDQQASTALTQFRASVDAAKEQWRKDVISLDAQIGFSKKPKLEALLTTMGLIGDESAFISGGQSGMGGPGGMGRGGMGQGGQGGMGQGGQGGFGGMQGGFGGGFGDDMGGPPGPPPDEN